MALRKALLIFTAIASVQSAQALAEQYVVRDQAQYRQAVQSLQPGDEVVLANGEWRDFQILFEGRGAAGRPITLRAEQAGGVILTGQSNLRLSGEHLLVSGLVFRDGHSPTDEVIAFRRDSRRLATHSRVTQVVIDRFNQPDRRAEDIWVAIYGTDNRIDHSHFEGKANAGVTLAVVRPRGQGQPNRHRIDHNYFGPRPNLGSNGGETIRIGTSEESLSDSNSVVEYNYFERCDGEVEIVSNKSGGNIFRGNVFYESRGALVLRHGGGNVVEGNVFLGNGKPDTGGIRVINPRQTVRNNYMEGLAGTGFASAITVMNGVPNSVINRYHQVVGAVIERNSVIESRRITLAAGADAERSAPPIDTRFAGNLVFNSSGNDPFRAEGDISGIAFAGNVQNPVTDPLIEHGFVRRPMTLSRASNGLLYPDDPTLAAVGASADLRPVGRDQTGVSWYPKRAAHPTGFRSGSVVEVQSGDSLADAVASARSGDTIRLAPGTYRVTAPIVVDETLTLAGPAGDAQAVVTFTGPVLFRIEGDGRLELSGLTISGAETIPAGANAVIRTSEAPMLSNYSVFIKDSSFVGLDGAPGFDVIAATPGTLADRIQIVSSRFDGVSGAVFDGRSEPGDRGHYSAEHLDIHDAQFRNVAIVADLFRGGRDESTFGPQFSLSGSTIEASGVASGASLRLSGVQHARILNNRFLSSAPVEVEHSVGTPDTLIAGNSFDATPEPVLRELYAAGPHRAVLSGNRVGAAQ